MSEKFDGELGAALKEAEEQGWIDDADDPWADFNCFGDKYRMESVMNCDECPPKLRNLCEDETERRQNR